MNILILRTQGNVVNINSYNMQEIGLAQAFVKNGHNCDVAVYGGKEKRHSEIFNGEYPIKIIWLEGKSIALNGIFKNLNNLIDQYDVVQVSDYDQLTSYWLYTSKRYRGKIVLYHGPYLNDFNKKYRLKCRVIDALPMPQWVKEELPCFAKSKMAEDFLSKRGFKNITVVGVGLDTSRFEISKNLSKETKKVLDKVLHQKTILYVGKIENRRNVLFLIDVLAEVKQVISNVSLIIVGDGEEGYKKECIKKINDYGLADSVNYVQKMNQDQLAYLYKKANLFVLPTSYEIFGMVLMEAMYYGVPVITTYNGGSSTLFNSKCGVVCDLNTNRWSSEIVNLLNNDNRCQNIGEISKVIVKEKCSWDVIAKKMLERYPK